MGFIRVTKWYSLRLSLIHSKLNARLDLVSAQFVNLYYVYAFSEYLSIFAGLEKVL